MDNVNAYKANLSGAGVRMFGAFVELRKTKPTEKITIKELCEKAEICNSTFYTHFNSLDDFLSTLKEDILNSFLNIANNVFIERGSDSLGAGVLISYIKIAQKISERLSKKNSNIEKVFVLPNGFILWLKNIITASLTAKLRSALSATARGARCLGHLLIRAKHRWKLCLMPTEFS